jgi:Holliday junction resolvase RusA-like endonuclease
MQLIFGLPPSDNQRLIYSPRSKRMVSSPKYRKWFEEAGAKISAWCIANEWKILEPSYEEQYEFDVKIFHDHPLSDLGNYHKSIKDVLTGRIYVDDRHVSLHQILPMTRVSNKGIVLLSLDYRIFRHG